MGPSTITSKWRHSLRFRAVVTTVLLTVAVLAIAGTVLLSMVSSGLEDAKQRGARAEASAGRSIARSAAQGLQGQPPRTIINGLDSDLSRRAGEPPSYEVVLAPQPGSGLPKGSTPLVDDHSIPPELAEAVSESKGQVWYPTDIRYDDGRNVPGVIVGSPVKIRGLGEYTLYYLFPMNDVAESVQLVRSAVIGVGIALVITLGGVAFWLSSRLVRPLRQAATTAGALAQGELDRRLDVSGEDEMARLASVFNTMADNLSDQIGRLQRLSESQRRFVSDVSHELRTPLTTIRMAADVTTATIPEDEPVATRSAELLLAEVDRFDSLLADLLEVSRFDADAAVLESDEVDLSGLVATVVHQFDGVAGGNDVELRVSVPDGVDCILSIDSRRIKRIVRNLIVNAVEHGASRPVDVAVECSEDEVKVTVVDHGPGIRPADLDKVFERFWRADPSRVRTLGGTGLGLAIAREDAKLHGGELTASSASGQGATFTLTLPRPGSGLPANSQIQQLP